MFLSRGDWKGEASCKIIITLRQEIEKWVKCKKYIIGWYQRLRKKEERKKGGGGVDTRYNERNTRE